MVIQEIGKTRMSRCAGYNDYHCNSASDCKLCGYDGEKLNVQI